MADLVPIALAGGSNAGRYPQIGVARLLNCYIEEMGEMGKTPFSIVAIDGLEEWGTLPDATGGVRAMLTLESELLTVAARRLYRSHATGGGADFIGGIAADGIVTMAANRASPQQVAIVVDGNYWIYTNGTLTVGADEHLPPPIAVTEVSGYLVFAISDGRFFIAGPDTTEVEGLDFASAEASSDRNVMVARRGREAVIFGTGTAEFWAETGAADFPFSRVQVIDVGCYAPGSVANVLVLKGAAPATDTLIWAASDHKGAYAAVVLLDGYSAVPISTLEVDRLIRDEPNLLAIRAYSWTEGGHSFYAISGSSFTKVFDTRSGRWHDRVSHGSDRWRPSEHATFGGMQIFGDAEEGTLYRSRPDLTDEVGDRIRTEIVLPTIHMYPRDFKVGALHIDAITGVGINSGDDTDDDPVLMIEASRDAGASWGPQRHAKLGRMAQRQARIKERTWGNFNHNGMTVRLSCTAKVARAIQGAAIEAEQLA